ncbi:ELM1/GtrOC1 family putative glycosyltransferase [Malonomonas rubra]|uniref:ELM1/GtrOC1 family putative glycosyltransferase n=1 Tax=Malonomonas rubra TaxID=57040 RepID=UPI0026EBCC9E|nr:ELM1/GtrOC1 family putative glycosyltransferase [Malonomonas rubra]
MQGRLLIISDGKPGHLNQSIAFAKHLGFDYDITEIRFRSRLAKALSYLADRLYLSIPSLFQAETVSGDYQAVVSTGSETYYANRVLASQRRIKSIAIMLPKGYRYDFDLIVAQQHDDPPTQENIISLPVNLAYVEPQGLVSPEEGHKYISVIIGGDSKQGRMDPTFLAAQLEKIFSLLPGYDFWLTTSRRTPASVETVLRKFTWNRAIFYSQEQINPIPDFLAHSEYVFLTADSTSMISEAVSFGTAGVEVLLPQNMTVTKGKFGRMLTELQKINAVHLFDGQVGGEKQKIDQSAELGGGRL